VWEFQFEKIENNLFNLSFTSTQAAWCEISPQHFESSDTPQEEPLTEEMKPESTVEAKAGAHGEWCLSTVNLDLREVQGLELFSISLLESHDREKVR
jgi:hypothetical protein